MRPLIRHMLPCRKVCNSAHFFLLPLFLHWEAGDFMRLNESLQCFISQFCGRSADLLFAKTIDSLVFLSFFLLRSLHLLYSLSSPSQYVAPPRIAQPCGHALVEFRRRLFGRFFVCTYVTCLFFYSDHFHLFRSAVVLECHPAQLIYLIRESCREE